MRTLVAIALFLCVASMNRVPLMAITPSTSPRGLSDADFEHRKQQQAWLWETPKRQNPPPVTRNDWPRSAVDRFILRRLEQENLSPAPPADDRTWLRRVYFAVVGLPPSPAEIRAFLNDASGKARENVMDRLLASPHFGERWGRHWLDLMRYAESRGHEGDYIIANAWQYRDYVIRAFNEDLPYQQLLIEHLAGDLMPSPRLRLGTDINESVLGTGWAFLGEENHSPVDIRQDECERIDNKIDVFSKTFLGLTVSCARCHDHKFDPIRSQDYYAMSGFFLGSSFRQVRFESMENHRLIRVELDELRARHLPRMIQSITAAYQPGVMQTAEYLLAARSLTTETSSVSPSAIDSYAETHSLNSARLASWMDQLRQASTHVGSPLHAMTELGELKASNDRAKSDRLKSSTDEGVSLPSGARITADFTSANQQPWKVDGEAFGTGPATRGDFVLEETSTNIVFRIMPYGAARRDLFWNRMRTAPENQDDSGRLGATSRAGQMLRTPTMTLDGGKLHYLLKGRTRVYAAVDSHLMIEGPLHGKLVQTFDSGAADEPSWVTHDLSAYSGHRVHIEFGPDGHGPLELLMVVESTETPKWSPGISTWTPSDSAADFANEFQRAVVASSNFQEPASPALANWMLRNPQLFQDQHTFASNKTIGDYRDALGELASRVKWESRTAIAWFDGTGVDENLLIRGKPGQPGSVAPRSLPAAFSPTASIRTTSSSGRYELALQLTDPSNPLVARVIVNRVCHHLFGRGLVATVDNFGALGERPSHPELLDYLAWQWVREGNGSLKRLIKDLVLTQTFGMSSRISDRQSEEKDPANALLHRMPVRRLEGEIIRDALLAVSGRLNPTVGGPPITVYLTEFLVGRSRPEKSGPLDGDGRRSIYTAMRRNFLPTLMQTFDMPTPFSTVGRRNTTNVPAQALALMNDALFHEQAMVWARRLLSEKSSADAVERVNWLFETAYCRPPANPESNACLESLAEFERLHPDSSQPELDQWSDLCHALLNANDFIYVK